MVNSGEQVSVPARREFMREALDSDPLDLPTVVPDLSTDVSDLPIVVPDLPTDIGIFCLALYYLTFLRSL